ncbi:MAG: hypothetical protein AAFX44_00290 [Pseudomonadota bacterium]
MVPKTMRVVRLSHCRWLTALLVSSALSSVLAQQTVIDQISIDGDARSFDSAGDADFEPDVNLFGDEVAQTFTVGMDGWLMGIEVIVQNTHKKDRHLELSVYAAGDSRPTGNARALAVLPHYKGKEGIAKFAFAGGGLLVQRGEALAFVIESYKGPRGMRNDQSLYRYPTEANSYEGGALLLRDGHGGGDWQDASPQDLIFRTLISVDPPNAQSVTPASATPEDAAEISKRARARDSRMVRKSSTTPPTADKYAWRLRQNMIAVRNRDFEHATEGQIAVGANLIPPEQPYLFESKLTYLQSMVKAMWTTHEVAVLSAGGADICRDLPGPRPDEFRLICPCIGTQVGRDCGVAHATMLVINVNHEHYMTVRRARDGSGELVRTFWFTADAKPDDMSMRMYLDGTAYGLRHQLFGWNDVEFMNNRIRIAVGKGKDWRTLAYVPNQQGHAVVKFTYEKQLD